MKMIKKVVSHLHLCYSLAELTYRGEPGFLVATEKQDPCILFDEEGRPVAVPWTGPGGTMSMQQIPGKDGEFLATHGFYSPDDSQRARIVRCAPDGEGGWSVQTLVEAPFVHRFGILERNGIHYLLLCCLKSGHAYDGDWRFPGAVYAAVLPEDLSGFDSKHPLPIHKLRDGMLKNHGYSSCLLDGVERALVSSEEGVFLFTPPADPLGEWEIRCLLETPASDAVLCDLDGDGQMELGVIEEFHGDRVSLFHLGKDGRYEKCWEHPERLEMLHAIWAGNLCGKNTLVVGNRKGKRKTLMITYETNGYQETILEEDTGAANVLHLTNRKGQDLLVVANREIDEVALFILEP